MIRIKKQLISIAAFAVTFILAGCVEWLFDAKAPQIEFDDIELIKIDNNQYKKLFNSEIVEISGIIIEDRELLYLKHDGELYILMKK